MQFAAIFADTWRLLRARKVFWVALAITLLVGLFLIQKKGTSVVGRVFGPVCLVWFITLGALGLLCAAAVAFAVAPIGVWERASVYSIFGWQTLCAMYPPVGVRSAT